MSSKLHSQPHSPNDSESRSPDIRGARTLATFLAQQRGTPVYRESLHSRGAGPSQEPRNHPQLQGHRYPKEPLRAQDAARHPTPQRRHQDPPKARDAARHASPHQHQRHSSHPIPLHSQQRPPSLSLDTRNLSQPLPSPFPTSGSPSESLSPLHTDLTSLKAGLESLWSLSSQKLHVLHRTLAAQADTLRALGAANARLESSAAPQRHETDRLRMEHARALKEAQDAEEARKKALREREMLGSANARLWEDKARLEGEKRELRVKLDAETLFARTCEEELERIKKPPVEGAVRVKLEDDDEGGGGDGAGIPLKAVKRMIEERLRTQADDFTKEARELYDKLAHAQTRITELEAYLKRYSVTPGPNGTPSLVRITPPTPAPPGHGGDSHTNDPNATAIGSHPNPTHGMGSPIAADRATEQHPPPNGPGRTPPTLSPVTPHTGLPSSHSETEREFPFVQGWGGKKAMFGNVQTDAGAATIPKQYQKHDGRRHPYPAGPRDLQRVVSGPVESDRGVEWEREMQRRRLSAPTSNARAPGGASSGSPIMDALSAHGNRNGPMGTVRDAQGQVVSTYAGVGAGWRPAALPRSGTSDPPSRGTRSRPATPTDLTRPAKRARTTEPEDLKHEDADADVRKATQVREQQPAPPPPAPATVLVASPVTQLHEQPGAREMTNDERLMFSSLSSVLTKKRDGDGWKCVLCRHEKKSPTATFDEATPIGFVTSHVKDTHVQFWRELHLKNPKH